MTTATARVPVAFVGRKAAPGPLYGISRSAWSALAIAVTYTLEPGSAAAA